MPEIKYLGRNLVVESLPVTAGEVALRLRELPVLKVISRSTGKSLQSGFPILRGLKFARAALRQVSEWTDGLRP